METRLLGAIGHESSVVTLGAFALQFLDREAATAAAEDALSRGVNHVDVAPTYGDAERKLRPFLADHREEVFLGCKTQARDRAGAREELEASMDRLGVDRLDLYQFHAVTSREGLDELAGEGGALEAVEAAREEGLVDHVGLTSHGDPRVIRAAIERLDLDTVMFPLNFVLAAREGEEYDYRSVLELADEHGVGTIGIKAIAKGSWPDSLDEDERPYGTWYEPFDDQETIDDAVAFALSAGLTTTASAGDPALLPKVVAAGERVRPLDDDERRALLERGREHVPPVPTD
ncbi:MAG: aldo/keto reductase [Halobacteriaceae archaeon]